ncbi:MAG: 3-hydroxyisobutyrate dehydrogenase [Hyphomicrobium sp.]|uniref:3-hydroxyisobutyrate dehydrogenase n=1 Tax=Hyphomicrobium sp. CS1BSMeth3 TaxID=1892844 RepID=UPI00086EEAC0|nr:3-hydroxyisobutyrate dehydrogenase [Hyphomicrobium sp. CS1BSMeth3]MBN9259334.1 3-hydroxyisobutyrate dehydrogenase [Hyphomicrobium sp.]MBN9263978.1 3-hydroxyisobutyrate dehydrogenase [Hyphomicrobium sp.]ODT30917.1 MAG: 3-hydroxyisobutyrate dehydrogenase [Hyphomicrobium sp. SCN 65-11]
MARIGFIGLGNMGLPMAGNLVKAGHQVLGFDLVNSNVEKAVARKVEKAHGAADVAKDADCVITMLPAGKHVLDVWGGGLLAAAKPGTIFIDCSTIDVASARKAHDMAAKAGMLSLDAPVSGGVGGAEAASLTLMVGGTKEAFAKGQPILSGVGKKVVHCGDPGAGQSAKICNNMMLAITMIGTCEAFNLAEKLGLSHEALFDVASTSSGQSWAVTTYCPVPGPVPTSPANNHYKPGFAAALMQKDLGLSQEAARSAGASTPMGAAASQLYNLFVSQGHGGDDFSGIINMIRGKA